MSARVRVTTISLYFVLCCFHCLDHYFIVGFFSWLHSNFFVLVGAISYYFIPAFINKLSLNFIPATAIYASSQIFLLYTLCPSTMSTSRQCLIGVLSSLLTKCCLLVGADFAQLLLHIFKSSLFQQQ